MKVKCEIVMDLSTGDYEITAHNVSAPGEPMDVEKLREALAKAVSTWKPTSAS